MDERDGSSMDKAIIRIMPPDYKTCHTLDLDGKWYYNPHNHPKIDEVATLKALEEVAIKNGR